MKKMMIILETFFCLCLVFFPVHGFAESTGKSVDPAMPTEAEHALGTVLELSRSLQETPGNVRTSARYTGMRQVQGKNCYMFTVYAHLPERYENLGEYAVEQKGTHVYRYDVVEDAYHIVHPGTPANRK